MNQTLSRNHDLHFKMGLRLGQRTAIAKGVIAKPDTLNNKSFFHQYLPMQVLVSKTPVVLTSYQTADE